MIKANKAYLQNCEGFMYEVELVEKINNHFETTKKEMTLDGLTNLEPKDFFKPGKDNVYRFTKEDLKKILKLLGTFGYSLKNMACSNKYRWGQLIERTNVDWGDEISVAPKEIEDAATKVYEDLKNFEPINQTQ